MRRAILRALLIASATMGLPAPVKAADFTVDGQPPSDNFVAQVERIRRIYPSVWRENVLAQVKLTYASDPNVERLEKFESFISRDLCTLKATVSSVTSQIVLSHDATIIGLSVDQAIIFYLLGRPEFADPQKIVDYVRSEVRRVSAILEKESKTRNPDCGKVRLDFRSPLGFTGMSTAEYDRLMSEFNADPMARSLGDVVGGASIFFVALHEAGHVWTGNDNDESQADAFAIQTMRAGGVPPSLGVSALLVLAEAADFVSTQTGLERPQCRLLRLAEDDHTLSTPQGRAFVGPMFARAEQLRQFWLTTYADACE